MLIRVTCVFVLLAAVAAAGDGSWLICLREEQVAKAISSKDRVRIWLLTNNDFHVHWTEGSEVRSITTSASRDGWMDALIHLQTDAYEAVISRIDVVGSDQAFVGLKEIWMVHSPAGTRIEKRFDTRDMWFRQRGVWKLTGRDCHSLSECRLQWPLR